MKPTLVLVGRPNVGKSTLFNRLTRSRDALVADLPGLTRDRHYGQGRVGDKPFIVVDTGGFEPVAKEGILSEMARQAREAIAEADVIVFLTDGRAGLTPQDKRIALQLRKASAPVILAVNKTEGMREEVVTAEFHELALGAPRPSPPSTARACARWWKRRSRDFPSRRPTRSCPTIRGWPSWAVPTSASPRW